MPLDPNPSPPVTVILDSDDFGARHDMSDWRDGVARTLLGLDYRVIGDTPFHARLKTTFLGDTVVSTHRVTPAETFRDRELIDGNAERMVFAWARGGPVRASQRGRETVLAPGDAAVLTTAEFGRLDMLQGGTLMGILVPVERIRAAMPDFHDRIMTTLPRALPELELVRSYFDLAERRAAETSERGRHLMGGHLVDLIAHAVGRADETRRSTDRPSERAARFALACREIERRISDPGLNLGDLTEACGLPPRTIQSLFEQAGTSYSSHLIELRLTRAHALLSDPGNNTMRVIDVAFASGFSDVSYFNRRFRARFGETPTAVRRGR